MQTEDKRMSAHIGSTADMLMEMFEAQKVPSEVAIVAMFESIMRVETMEAENLSEFINNMKLILSEMDKAVPKFMIKLISEAFYKKSTDPHKRFEAAIHWIKNGPETIKLRNGKVVLIKE